MRMILNNASGSFFLPTLSRGWVVGEASGNSVPFSGIYAAPFCINVYYFSKFVRNIPN
jgi:hypothetical protein